MNTVAYEPAYDNAKPAAEPPLQGNHHLPELDRRPEPPRMRMVPGEGGLGVMFAALAKAQASFKPVKADAHVQVDTREKGSYKFSYAPLENVLAACVPALNAEGFFFSQPLYSAADGEGYVLRTCLMHASGGLIEVETYIPKPAGRIQDLGSAITYQRRYVAQALFGVNSEDDDDGAQASGDKRTVQPRQQQPSAQPQQRPANGGPAPAPKGGPSSNAAPPASGPSTAGDAPSTATAPATTSNPAPANETTVERELTAEQHKDLAALFKQLTPRLSAPAASKLALDVTGRMPDKMTEEDGKKLAAHLRERIAKQGAA